MVAECTAVTSYVFNPDLGFKVAVFKFTKANDVDTLSLTQTAEDARATTGISYRYGFVINNIVFARVTTDADGVLAPVTWATGIVTGVSGAGTGAATALVIGY